MKSIIVIIMSTVAILFSEVTFTDISAGLPGVEKSSVSWGDFNNDGNLDILLTGNYGSSSMSKLYRNSNGVFLISGSIESVGRSSVSLGDYDNDGDLDILLTGNTAVLVPASKIYRNNGGWSFTDINAGLTGVANSSVSWGDYDNDGDLDILLTGEIDNYEYVSKIYRNDSGILNDINAGLTGVTSSSVSWFDFDNDGDLDILLTGYSAGGKISKIYRNDSGTFNDINAGLTGVSASSVSCGDYDNDGDLDILLTGNSDGGRISKIYRNDSGIFNDINAGLTGVSSCSVSWGDYDNDGDLDILLTGDSDGGKISRIYRNDTGSFSDINAGLTGVTYSSVSWGDYDNDGDLDILLTGYYSSSEIISKIYRNDSIQKNTPPVKPSNLVTQVGNDRLKLSFDVATDAQTAQEGLSYNIELTVDGQRLKSSMSDITSGYRKIAAVGNASQNTFWELENFIPQCERIVSWKVQAVDHCFAGSEFETFPESGLSGRDLEVHSKTEMYGTDFLSWEYAFTEYINNYIIQIDDDPAFGSPIEQVIPLEKDADDSKDNNKTLFITKTMNTLADYDSLNNNTTYYWRVKPVYKGSIASRYNTALLSFVFNTVVYPPSSISIAVEGNYVTVSWGSGKEESKGEVYNVYGSDDPYAEFPSGWTYQANVNGTEWVTTATAVKRFYCVTAASVVK